MSLDLNQCDKLCHQCIKKYIKKHKLKKGDSFGVVGCTGIPLEYVPDSILASLGEDPETIKAILNPVLWANKFLDWHCIDPKGEVWKRKTEEGTLDGRDPYDVNLANQGRSIYHRPYQLEMLCCTAKRKAFRIGRQAGKCLTSDTLIQMADGSLKQICDINPGDFVLTLDDEYKFTPARAFLSPNGNTDVYQLKLKSGQTISASLNHPFLCRKPVKRCSVTKKMIYTDEWVDLRDINPGDYVATPQNVGDIGKEDFNEDNRLLSLLGFLISDGNVKGRNYRFSNVNQDIIREINDSLSLFGCSLKQYECDRGTANYNIVYTEKYVSKGRTGLGHKRPFRRWLEQVNIYNCGSYEKKLPNFVFSLKRQYIAKIIRAMWGCDGWACVGRSGKPELGYCSVSRELIDQLSVLLRRFGIYSTFQHKKVNYNGSVRVAYQLTITRQKDIVDFSEFIGISGKSKELGKVVQESLKKGLSYKTLAYTHNDVVFSRVDNKKYIGQEATWDLTVENHHNFIANDIVTHNSESLCIAILYNIFTQEKFHVEVIAPYQSQIDLVFKRLMELINSNPILRNSVERSVKAPQYTIELKNGSQVIGFTAGTRSKQEAGASRGQHAGMLVFDECDYLSRADVDAALAVIINYKNATVWMSSTPTGRREKFYESCLSKQYKEFHFPSHVNPNWDEETEAYFRSELTEDGYIHEILAQFGEQEEGVYRLKYVEAAQSDYEYKQMKPDPRWSYMIGVDWNKLGMGTTIAIVGFNPNDNYFYLVDKHNIPASQRTQLNACQRVAELNRLWNASYIYVDVGYGATQLEILHDHGNRCVATHGPNHPDSRLRNIVKGYDFGSSIEIRDLFTKQPVKKPAKPFLVENSVRRFENMQFKYPASDKHYTDQLLGYIIDRVSVTGRPLYKQQNEKAGDHFLDSVNLALVAFALETSQFGKPIYSSAITFAGRFGEAKDVVSSDSMIKQSENHRPQGGRASVVKSEDKFFQSVNGEVPAANTHTETTVRPWNWKGFLRDEPRPHTRSMNQAMRDAERRVLKPLGRNRPRRKKF